MSSYKIKDLSTKINRWLSRFERFVRLDSNGYQSDQYAAHDCLLACGVKHDFTLESKIENAIPLFKEFLQGHKDSWIFGHISYEAKDIFEIASSGLPAHIDVPLISFFVPQIILKVNGDELSIVQSNISDDLIFHQIDAVNIEPIYAETHNAGFFPLSRNAYIEKVDQLLGHIHIGNIYEVNFCQSAHYEDVHIHPYDLYNRLNSDAKAPFGTFYKVNHIFLCCASPERFLAKRGHRLICQPIKGTNRRLHDPEDNSTQQFLLKHDPKERSENVMIVDLMRNDLSKICKAGSVIVEELCGVYAFEYVNQMISTVVGEVDPDINFADAMAALFPMGSMTGAPKIRSLELINTVETHQRGLFSGSVGYIDPDGNWDFNVVIRSIVYDDKTKRASITSGGAITAMANSEAEYNESMLKMESLRKLIE